MHDYVRDEWILSMHFFFDTVVHAPLTHWSGETQAAQRVRLPVALQPSSGPRRRPACRCPRPCHGYQHVCLSQDSLLFQFLFLFFSCFSSTNSHSSLASDRISRVQPAANTAGCAACPAAARAWRWQLRHHPCLLGPEHHYGARGPDR